MRAGLIIICRKIQSVRRLVVNEFEVANRTMVRADVLPTPTPIPSVTLFTSPSISRIYYLTLFMPPQHHSSGERLHVELVTFWGGILSTRTRSTG